MRIRDPGWKNLDTGSGINIPDPQKSTVKSTQVLSRHLGSGRHLGFLFLNRYCGTVKVPLFKSWFRTQIGIQSKILDPDQMNTDPQPVILCFEFL